MKKCLWVALAWFYFAFSLSAEPKKILMAGSSYMAGGSYGSQVLQVFTYLPVMDGYDRPAIGTHIGAGADTTDHAYGRTAALGEGGDDMDPIYWVSGGVTNGVIYNSSAVAGGQTWDAFVMVAGSLEHSDRNANVDPRQTMGNEATVRTNWATIASWVLQHSPDCKLYLQEAHARPGNYSVYPTPFSDEADMQSDNTATVEGAQNVLNARYGTNTAEICHIGKAWEHFGWDNSSDGLYRYYTSSVDHHGGSRGELLTAMIDYATVYQEDVSGIYEKNTDICYISTDHLELGPNGTNDVLDQIRVMNLVPEGDEDPVTLEQWKELARVADKSVFLAGDANLDGVVDTIDYQIVSGNEGVVSSNSVWRDGDFDADGDVDSADLSILNESMGLAILTDVARIDVAEGASSNVLVSLSQAPVSATTVQVVRISGDSDLNVAAGSELVFTTSGWSNAQVVSFSADLDEDAENGIAGFELRASGAVSAPLEVAESDPDVGVVCLPTELLVAEGSDAVFSVYLDRLPQASVTVQVVRLSGDTNLSLSGSTSLVFSTNSWNVSQEVLVQASEDADQTDGSALLRFQSDQSASLTVMATEVDNDRTPFYSGSLLKWNLNTAAGKVYSTNASDVAAGIVSDGVSGVITAAPASVVVSSSNGLGQRDCDDPTIATALGSGHYYSWSIEPEAPNALTVTGLYLKTENNTPMSGVIFASVSGFNDGDQLQVISYGAQETSIDLRDDIRFSGITNSLEFRLYGYDADSEYDYLILGNAYSSADNTDDLIVSGALYGEVSGQDDVDSDGLPDSWEVQHFGSSAAIDPDAVSSNGINSILEAYIAGLDPTSGSASFAATTDFSGSGNLIQWNAVTGRTYKIFWTTNLQQSMSLIASNITESAFTDTVHTVYPNGFYQIEVELSP